MKKILKLSFATMLVAFMCSLTASAAIKPVNDPTTGKAKKTATTNKANHKTNKATKTDDTNKPAFACFYFLVSNTVVTGSCDPITNPITLTFPTTIPPTSVSGCIGSGHYCYVGFPGYKNVGTVSNPIYHPSNTPNGGTEITNYCSFSCSVEKN